MRKGSSDTVTGAFKRKLLDICDGRPHTVDWGDDHYGGPVRESDTGCIPDLRGRLIGSVKSSSVDFIRI